MNQEISMANDAESFWSLHKYLAMVWEERIHREAGKKIPRNPFNYLYNSTPFHLYFESTQGKDPDYQVIFNDPLRQDFFQEIKQFHRSLSFSWEQSGFTRNGTFTEQIKVYHEFFENAANHVWTFLQNNYGLAPLEILARLFPLYSLLSNQIYLISDFCLKVGIPAQDYCEYYTVFNEILRKGHNLFQLALSEPDLMETLLELNKQLIIYIVMFGFPYFQWQECHGWCPEELAGVLEEECALISHLGRSLEELLNPKHIIKIRDWIEKSQEMKLDIPLVPTITSLPETLLIENIRLCIQAYNITSMGAARDKLQQKFNLPPNQINLLLYSVLMDQDFNKLMGGKKPKPYSPSPPISPLSATPLVQSTTSLPIDRIPEFSQKLGELGRFLTPANLCDPPAFTEIDLILQILKYSLKKDARVGTS